MRLIVGGRERSRGKAWFTQQKLLPIKIFLLFLWKSLCHVFVFTANFCLPKGIFHTRVYRETTPVHCCEMSRHISRAWQGRSPRLGARAAELSAVSATVVEAVDRSRNRKTYVPLQNKRGEGLLVFKEAIITAAHGHQSLLFEEGLSQFKVCVHTHTYTHTHRGLHSHALDTHRCGGILFTELKSKRLYVRIAVEIIC